MLLVRFLDLALYALSKCWVKLGLLSIAKHKQPMLVVSCRLQCPECSHCIVPDDLKGIIGGHVANI